MGQGAAAPGFNELEIARGVVSALSYSAPTAAKEFHVRRSARSGNLRTSRGTALD